MPVLCSCIVATNGCIIITNACLCVCAESLMCAVGICEKSKLIDVTSKHGTTESLTEARLPCTMQQKDLYLYYFLRQFAGRTLVFANSKDCIRRLSSVFRLLHCGPLVLHADMQQRQRLKNLDRFKSTATFSLLFQFVCMRTLCVERLIFLSCISLSEL